jgi:hypothetical protein
MMNAEFGDQVEQPGVDLGGRRIIKKKKIKKNKYKT